MEKEFGLENLSEALIRTSDLDMVDVESIDIFELFNGEILEIIPGLKLIKTAYKGVLSVRDKLFTKKFLLFIKEFNEQKIDEGKYQKFKEKFDSDRTFRTKVMENLILHIDQFSKYEKVKILARLFSAYLNGHFDLKHLLRLADCLDKVIVEDLVSIPEIDTTEGKEVRKFDETKVSTESNLISAGLAIKVSVWSSGTYPTQAGKDIYKYGIK